MNAALSLRRFESRVAALLLLAMAAACTTGAGQKAASPVAVGPVETSSQPRVATYNCADGGMITIENLGASVHITGADEQPIDLPAAPAAQTTRYGEQPYALVLEGRDALFMKSGQPPLSCTR
jgi:membrane-bound inhibitor of C-type lysozyme